jgi:DNA-binding NtrC family response regulator
MITNRDLKVFVVDDDAFCRELYAQYLHNLGFASVFLFEDGESCLNSMSQRPDIIFLDHDMQPLDGLEVMKKIKRTHPDIYLIIVSGQENIQVSVNALKYGAFDYIIKGDKDEEMIARVTEKIVHIMNLLNKTTAPEPPPAPLSCFLSSISDSFQALSALGQFFALFFRDTLYRIGKKLSHTFSIA